MTEKGIAKTKRKVFLSASRIETFKTCSALYYAKYILKLPDPVGEAARRGSVAHDTLELLANKRHYNRYSDAIHHDTCTEVPALWRYIKLLAKKYNVADEKSLKLIDGYIMVALKSEFWGPKGTVEGGAEKAFEMEITNEFGSRYAVKGFIDRWFVVVDGDSKVLYIKDYKSGSTIFSGEKATWNVQALIYQLVSRKLWPEIIDRKFHFLFLKQMRNNRINHTDFTESQRIGFEEYLASLQVAMEEFDESNALDNARALCGESCWLYGKECGAKRPCDYYAIVDKNGDVKETAFQEGLLTGKLKVGQTVEKKRYGGCPAYFDPKTERRRNLA